VTELRARYDFIVVDTLMDSRPNDRFGIGWARTETSNHFRPFLRDRLDLGLDREDAVELYYNAAVTGGLDATLDLQLIDPAIGKRTESSTSRLEHPGTTVIPGVRLYARF
jgi:porin